MAITIIVITNHNNSNLSHITMRVEEKITMLIVIAAVTVTSKRHNLGTNQERKT